MTSLADHYGGSFLTDGTHKVTVADFKRFTFNSGNPGVEIKMQSLDDPSSTTKVSFVLVEQALWKLASFARACGITQEQARHLDPYSDMCYRELIGRKLQAVVTQTGKYHECTDWYPINSASPESQEPQWHPEEQSQEDQLPTDDSDEIPF